MKSDSHARVLIDGKFFRLGERKFYAKGITYGPFAPNEAGETFPAREQVAKDFAQIKTLGANLLRVYYVPPRWLLDLADEHGLKILVDVPWQKHLCFLDSRPAQDEARKTVRQAADACKEHPAVFALSVVNEIPADIVRYSGAAHIESFIDELVAEVKSVDADCLCTFTNFPPTEFLAPQSIDFLCFNVYLHEQKSYEAYLARLQTLADTKPIMLGEFGIDSIREGEAHKCEILQWQIETAFRCGLAGTVVFSFTDDWFRGGYQIEDWAFGLTTQERKPKESFALVQKVYRATPYFPLKKQPKVSVVVASYNGARTLVPCLDSLSRLNYPNYEVILVDDGSKDNTPEIAARYPNVRYIRQRNLGLSAARNTGITVADGEIVAFTDSDCRADEDWLYYLVNDLLAGDFVGIGGHNFLPPEDSPVAAVVMAAPGGPAHVMLTDREAEHIPGCNMAFYTWALEEISGFDPIFHAAGDDVDVCWRLQNLGYKIGFSAAGFVWHYRRSTVRAYLRQQGGYGEAEALLARKHPEYFNSFGRGIWRGRIYASAKHAVVLQRAVIYHGLFGSGFFQRLYQPPPAFGLMFVTSLEYHALVTLPLLVLSAWWDFLLPLFVASLALSIGVCAIAAAQGTLQHKKWRLWSRPLLAALYFLQPLARGWARYKSQFGFSRTDKTQPQFKPKSLPTESAAFWSDKGESRYAFLDALFAKLKGLGWQHKTDSGWSDFDVEVRGNRWTLLQLVGAVEELAEGKTVNRWRFRSRWSFQARMIFWFLALLIFVAVALFREDQPWIWMTLVAAPMLGMFFDSAGQQSNASLATLLEEVAVERKWIKLSEKN